MLRENNERLLVLFVCAFLGFMTVSFVVNELFLLPYELKSGVLSKTDTILIEHREYWEKVIAKQQGIDRKLNRICEKLKLECG